MTDINGMKVELKTGFTVHNQDGTSELIVYVEPVIPPRGGGGEPMPEPKSA
jgi:hypothetical protein